MDVFANFSHRPAIELWVMSTMYPQGLPEELLPYAGIAQQYLFHYSRSHPELFEA